MKIATWNAERLRHKGKLDRIQDCRKEMEADRLILTETDAQIELPYLPASKCHCKTNCTGARTGLPIWQPEGALWTYLMKQRMH